MMKRGLKDSLEISHFRIVGEDVVELSPIGAGAGLGGAKGTGWRGMRSLGAGIGSSFGSGAAPGGGSIGTPADAGKLISCPGIGSPTHSLPPNSLPPRWPVRMPFEQSSRPQLHSPRRSPQELRQPIADVSRTPAKTPIVIRRNIGRPPEEDSSARHFQMREART